MTRADEMRGIGTYSAIVPSGYRVDVLENAQESLDIVPRAAMHDVEAHVIVGAP